MATLVLGCGSEDPAGPDTSSDVQPAAVAFDSQLDDWSQDPYTLEDVSVTADTITLRVSYAGGCEDHEFEFVAYAGWFESLPARAGVVLAHDDRGDDCEELVRRTLEFDLTPIKMDYMAAYDAGDRVVLDLWRGVHEIRPITYEL